MLPVGRLSVPRHYHPKFVNFRLNTHSSVVHSNFLEATRNGHLQLQYLPTVPVGEKTKTSFVNVLAVTNVKFS